MNEEFNSPENIISEQEVVEILNARGVEDSEAKAKLSKYAEQCERESEMESDSEPENEKVSNRARIKCVIKMSTVYLKTENYKEYGRESLEELLMNEGGGESTSDLADEIVSLLENYK